ncbi:MAG: VTT domain-containing protein [Sulfolobales archaeon]
MLRYEVSMLQWLDELLVFFRGPAGISMGMLGMFIISLVANSIPFVALPYLAIIMAYSVFIQDLTTKLLLALISALGATVGKLIIYSIGSLFRLGLSQKTLKNLELFNRIAGKSLFLAIFLFASLPLPDDVLYIPMGMTRYSIPKYLIAVLSGKTVLTSVIVFYSHLIKEQVMEFTFLLPVYVVITLLFSYIIIKVDWTAVLDTLTSKGVVNGINEFFRQLLMIFKLSKDYKSNSHQS